MQAPHSGNGRRAREPQSTLSRLLRNNAGNTMAIVGAALIPITAMIGSGLDMSRAYMAKSRLQSACDAASLAARRVMKNNELSANVTQTGQQFFDFNFPQGLYETEEFEPAITKPETGLVRIKASTRIPTTVMKLFGFSTLPLEVDCEASLNFVNTDVVLVLDVTLSMNDPIGGTPKITSLRQAVMALYDELAPIQTQLQSQGLRLRYGIVPYSSTVNVGQLIREEDDSYITNEAVYQSRVLLTKTETGIKQSTCNNKSNINRSWTKTSGNGNQAVGTCEYDEWLYQPRTIDVSTFKTGTSVPVPSRDFGTTRNATWNGCIEERDTVSTITAESDYIIPDGAFDLDINDIPDSNATRWRPQWHEVIYQRAAGTPSAATGTPLQTDAGWKACPNEARRLREWDRASLNAQVNALSPVGGTYHDIGMIWGARFISTSGIFADGCEEFNGMPCNRHVIFMTDGDQTAYCSNTYTAYGLEQNDMRVSGAGNCPNLLARHQKRFQIICNATKNMNVSVWVIAFGTSLNPTLTSCASNPSQAKTSTNQAQLIQDFREIGNQIGALRLTK